MCAGVAELMLGFSRRFGPVYYFITSFPRYSSSSVSEEYGPVLFEDHFLSARLNTGGCNMKRPLYWAQTEIAKLAEFRY